MISLVLVILIIGYSAIAVWAAATGGTTRLWLAAALAVACVVATGLLIASYEYHFRIDVALRSGTHLWSSLALAGGALGVPVLFSTGAVWLLTRRPITMAVRFAAALVAGMAGAFIGTLAVVFATFR